MGWIQRAEAYFEVHNTPDDLKVKLSRLCMESNTIRWFTLLRETDEHLTWAKFKQALLLQYGGTIYDNPFEELSMVYQVGTLDEYIEIFELISAQVPHLLENHYLGYFMGGLLPDFRQRVCSLHPDSRWRAMQVARDMEHEVEGTLASSDVAAFRA